MAGHAGHLPKIEILKNTLRSLQQRSSRISQPYHIVFFASSAQLLKPNEDLPPPHGSTDLAAGLLEAAVIKPEQTILISDGMPNDKNDAFTAVDALTGILNIIFVGPDNDVESLKFLKELAQKGQGQLVKEDLSVEAGKNLLPTVERLLLTEKGI
jgi:hypothetical protein